MTNDLTVIDNEVEVNQAQNDFVTVHGNLKGIIDMTAKAVQEVAVLADQSQSPRFYEALSGLLKTAIEANRELLDIYKRKKDLQTSTEGPQKVVNNLVVTSAQMLEMIKGDKDGDE